MRVVTICLPESYVEGMDALIKKDMYPSRSEVIRIAIRDMLVAELWKDNSPSSSRPMQGRGERPSSIPLDRISPVEQYR
jgi:Arc/MetJ-type ribon-helix-helix transcriptional regulator